MFYRRKFLLAVVQASGGTMGQTRLQKLLFWATRRSVKPAYYFVPYKYGCFSFESYADLRAMATQGLVKENEHTLTMLGATDYLAELTNEDRHRVMEVVQTFRGMDDKEVIRKTYLHFPFFAIKSEIAAKLLSREEMQTVEAARPHEDALALFTLGYEGLSIEQYLMRLIENDVKVLCDVRKNPISMKYGFSKSTLARNCQQMGIEYLHIPALGIESSQRKELTTREDYDVLFDQYQRTTLTTTGQEQFALLDLLGCRRRVALTCFEADPNYCHRSHLAKALTQLPGWRASLSHL